MSLGRWTQVVGLSIVNWLASVGCLAAAILAVGAGIPWTKLLLIYCAGATASSFNLTPGGLGVVEGVLTAGLVAAGMQSERRPRVCADLPAGELLAGHVGRLDHLLDAPSGHAARRNGRFVLSSLMMRTRIAHARSRRATPRRAAQDKG